MTQFIVIDQSVKTLGGHHFEYAERILDAARRRGFETLLLAHHDFAEHEASAHEVVPAFRRTFWENFSPDPLGGAVLRRLRGWYGGVRGRMRRAAIRRIVQFTYSPQGYYALWSWDGMRHQPILRRIISTEGLATDRSRTLAVLFRAIWWLYFGMRRLAGRGWVGWILRRTVRTLRMLVGFVSMTLVIPVVLLWQFVTRGRRAFASAETLFAEDLETALRGHQVSAISHIFVPTLHTAELEGIRRFLHRRPEFRTVDWSLLFRRNIFEGLPNEYAGQMERLRPLKVAFSRFLADADPAHVKLLTDTDELTEQYDELKVARFQTVPVPCDLDLAARAALTRRPAHGHAGEPALTLSYLGDARDEKGYGMLLDCQRNLHDDYIVTGRIRLLAQSNFNVAGGEPRAAMAQRMLRDCFTDGVELTYGPFGREAYQRLIASTDVMLIPYDQRNYAARSSGVFAEAVAAGIPSVVPSGTWMANVIELRRQTHLAELFPVPESPTGTQATLIDSVALPFQKMYAGLTVGLPKGCTHAVLRVTLDDADPTFVDAWVTCLSSALTPITTRQQTVRYSGPNTRLVFRCTDASSALIRVKPLARTVSLARAALHLDVYHAAVDLPLSVGSVVCSLIGDGFSEGVREVVDHYDHYAATARTLSAELVGLYSPNILVGQLVAGNPASSGDESMRTANAVYAPLASTVGARPAQRGAISHAAKT